MKVNILALDSASAVCGVALLCVHQSQRQHYVVEHHGSTEHAERMLPLIDQVLTQANLKRADLDLIAFAQGPGGFTGLRVACGVAQGLAYGLGLKVAAVPSLLGVAAQQAQHDIETIEIVVADARMQELYVGAYQQTTTGAWYALHKPMLIHHSQVLQYIQHVLAQQQSFKNPSVLRVSGDGLVAFPDLLASLQALPVHLGGTELPKATTIADLAWLQYQHQQLIEPALAAPLYVRNRVAFTTAERETGLGGNPSSTWQATHIRPAVATDLAEVAALEAELQFAPWSQSALESSMASGHVLWVASQADKVVAYAVMMPAQEDWELLLIGVAPVAQRQGVAQQLLCYAEQHARAQGAKKIHLEVRASNQPAIALYEGAGYVQVGIRKNYYALPEQQREDAVLYTKILA